jgi:hypothetical protein
MTLAWSTLLLLSVTLFSGASAARAQSASAAAAAAKASPALVSALSQQIGGSPEQAAGAAGALFGIAKSRLSAGDFSKVSGAVPGMDMLLKAAPAAGGSSLPAGLPGGLSQLGGTAAGLASAAGAFSKLGLKPEMVAAAVPVLTSFVTKSGGANVGNLLAGALK